MVAAGFVIVIAEGLVVKLLTAPLTLIVIPLIVLSPLTKQTHVPELFFICQR